MAAGTLVEHGKDISGTTAQRPTSADIGQRYFDTDLGAWLVWDGTAWKPASGIQATEVTFTETGAGTYTGSVTVPAGATLLDVIVHAVALWDAATSAVMKVGDVADDDGIFTNVNLKATDLLAGESISTAFPGGKQGADVVQTMTEGVPNTTVLFHVLRRYLATARVISGIITSVGAGTAGRTRMTVVYALPSKVIAATKV